MPNSPADAARRFDRCHVHAGRVIDWLATAVDPAGQPLANTYGLDDSSFRRGGDDLHDRIQALVAAAQAGGVLAIPNHHLQLWRVGDAGFLLTIDPPSPPRLCTRHLDTRDLLPARTSGSVAVLAVLTAVALAANQVLNAQDRTHPTTRPAPTTAFRDIRPAPPQAHRPSPPPSTVPSNPTGSPPPRRR